MKIFQFFLVFWLRYILTLFRFRKATITYFQTEPDIVFTDGSIIVQWLAINAAGVKLESGGKLIGRYLRATGVVLPANMIHGDITITAWGGGGSFSFRHKVIVLSLQMRTTFPVRWKPKTTIQSIPKPLPKFSHIIEKRKKAAHAVSVRTNNKLNNIKIRKWNIRIIEQTINS